MPLPKQGYKLFFLAIVVMALPKMGGKKSYEIYERVKKKVVMSTIFLQHFHNKSHMISHYQFKKICDKLIVAMPLPKQGGKKIFVLAIVAMALPKFGKKKKDVMTSVKE